MLYPPTLASTQPVFVISAGLTVKYTLNFTAPSEIKHLQVRIVYQSNNQYVVDTSTYPDGVIYINTALASGATGGTVDLNSYFSGWKAGTKYKIQMRFGSTTYSPTSGFAAWKQQQIENQTFSEWSTVMVVKAINQPTMEILNNTTRGTDIIFAEQVEKSLTPLFSGLYNESSGTEPRSKYRFALYAGTLDATQLDSVEPLEEMDSFEQADLNEQDSIDYHRFHTVLTNSTAYTVVYWVKTLNDYEPDPAIYQFTTNQVYLPGLAADFYALKKPVDDGWADGYHGVSEDVPYCRNNGCIRLYLGSSTMTFNGTYIISRSSEQTNFSYYEDIKYLNYFNATFVDTLVFTDYTIESGIKYKYALQYENAAGLRTEPVYTDEVSTDFEYSYLYRDGVQLKLMFNQKVSSFKHTVLRAKQDTIGDKYPHLVQNGYANYVEFPISGLISLHMDKDQTFFTPGSDGLYYQGKLVIPSRKFADRAGTREDIGKNLAPTYAGQWEHKSGYEFNDADYAYNDDDVASEENRTGPDKPTGAANSSSLSPSSNSSSLDWYETTDLVYDNIFIERKFREKVEEFLNDFTYKLYKSPTEGNIVVGLLNVSLTPRAELGRMIYEFSANAYEVIENTISNLNDSGIAPIGQAEDISIRQTVESFGQIIALPGDDIKAMIADKENKNLGDGYELTLSSISGVKIDLYPSIDLTNIDAATVEDALTNIATILADGEDPPSVPSAESLRADLTYNTLYARALTLRANLTEDNKAEYLRIIKVMQILLSQAESMVNITLNTTDLHILPLRPYQVQDTIDSIRFPSENNAWPILIDYSCLLTQERSKSVKVISSIEISRIWGQISGMFTQNDEVLKVYSYKYANSPTYRIYSGDGSIVVDDNTTMNLYKSLDLFKIIQEETRQQVERMYGTTFIQQDDGSWMNADGSLAYEFTSIYSFDIEADNGTTLTIEQADGTTTTVTIGSTPVLKNGLSIGKFHFIVESDGSISIEKDSAGNLLKTPSEYYRLTNSVASIKLDKAQYATVNYKCYTNQMRYESQEGGSND